MVYFQGFAERCFTLHPAPQALLRPDGSIATANPALARAAGVGRERVQDVHIAELVHLDDRRQVEACLVELGQGEQARTWRARLQPAGAGARWMDWIAAAPGGEGIVHVVLHDVHELREAERASRERERFLSSVFGNLIGMVYRCRNEPDWPLDFITAGCEQLTGYPSEEYVQHRVMFGHLIHPEDQGRVWDEVQAALAVRQPFTLRYRIRTASGEERWVYEQGCGVHAEDGALLALEGYVTDVTERVHAERMLAEKLRVIEAQAEAIRHLSTPIIEVWEGVLTMPIVGSIDRERASQLMEALLDAVVRSGSSHVIVDLTGVDIIDSAVASHLMKMLDAVRMLGAQGVLAGIRPEVARTIVALGVDLSRVPTRNGLRDALLDCIRAKSRAAKA
ncbi:PAS domain-containing protein [Sorangium sp. So ce291]|uniref:PAS domain-containing protein n=1 Tax=Sorangium sp. So ce291 TaxID=3133294 RepID=UPI003F5D6501